MAFDGGGWNDKISKDFRMAVAGICLALSIDPQSGIKIANWHEEPIADGSIASWRKKAMADHSNKISRLERKIEIGGHSVNDSFSPQVGTLSIGR